ncbi:hypothetical protein D3C84_611610 [compost metagenome]
MLRNAFAAGKQLLESLQLGVVGFLDQRGQADAGGRHRLRAAVAGLLLLLAEYPGCECSRFLGGRPQVAHQAVVAALLADARGVVDWATGQQVVPGLGHVTDDANGLLPRSTGSFAADPRHPIVAPGSLDLIDCRDRVGVRGQGFAHGLTFSQLPPTRLFTGDIGHLVGDRPAGAFGPIEVQAGLQDAVGDEVVERGIRSLQDQRRQ